MEQSGGLVCYPLSIDRLPPYLHQKYFLIFFYFFSFFSDCHPLFVWLLYILSTFLSHSLPMCVFLCTDRSVSAHIHPSLSLSVSHFFSSSSSLFLLLNSDKCFPGSSQKKFSREWMQHMRAWSSGITLIKYRIMIEKKLKKWCRTGLSTLLSWSLIQTISRQADGQTHTQTKFICYLNLRL